MTRTHLTVAAVVENKNRYLFVEELVGGRKVINQPAGHVEPHETLAAAVVREMLEETAWHFTPTAIVGLYLWTQPQSRERFLRIVFTGGIDNHEADRELDTGILRTLWMSREELMARADDLRSPMVPRALDDYRAGQRFPVTMFQQVELDALAANAEIVR